MLRVRGRAGGNGKHVSGGRGRIGAGGGFVGLVADSELRPSFLATSRGGVFILAHEQAGLPKDRASQLHCVRGSG